MLHGLDPLHLLEGVREESAPVVGGHEHIARLVSHQLRRVRRGGRVDDVDDVGQAGNSGAAQLPLEEAEAPVGGELGVTSQHEVDGDASVQARQDSPRQVPQHVRVLVLARTVVGVQVHLRLTHAEVGEVVV